MSKKKKSESALDASSVGKPLTAATESADDSVAVSPKAPNLEFIGVEPVEFFHYHGELIVLPEDQSEPFYHEKAAVITRLLPTMYKSYLCNCAGLGD